MTRLQRKNLVEKKKTFGEKASSHGVHSVPTDPNGYSYHFNK
jgi:hypothetical protein